MKEEREKQKELEEQIYILENNVHLKAANKASSRRSWVPRVTKTSASVPRDFDKHSFKPTINKRSQQIASKMESGKIQDRTAQSLNRKK